MVPTLPLHRNYPAKCHRQKTCEHHIRTHGGVRSVLVLLKPSAALRDLLSELCPVPGVRLASRPLLLPVVYRMRSSAPRDSECGHSSSLDPRRTGSGRPDISTELSPTRLACPPPTFPSRGTALPPCPPRQRLGSPWVSSPASLAPLHRLCLEPPPCLCCPRSRSGPLAELPGGSTAPSATPSDPPSRASRPGAPPRTVCSSFTGSSLQVECEL